MVAPFDPRFPPTKAGRIADHTKSSDSIVESMLLKEKRLSLTKLYYIETGKAIGKMIPKYRHALQ